MTHKWSTFHGGERLVTTDEGGCEYISEIWTRMPASHVEKEKPYIEKNAEHELTLKRQFESKYPRIA